MQRYYTYLLYHILYIWYMLLYICYMWKRVCICVCIYVYMYTYTSIYIHTCIYTYTYGYRYISGYIHICMNTCTCLHRRERITLFFFLNLTLVTKYNHAYADPWSCFCKGVQPNMASPHVLCSVRRKTSTSTACYSQLLSSFFLHAVKCKSLTLNTQLVKVLFTKRDFWEADNWISSHILCLV